MEGEDNFVNDVYAYILRLYSSLAGTRLQTFGNYTYISKALINYRWW